MAGRTRINTINRIESEIDKNREESNWKKVIELAEQLKNRSEKKEHLSNFLIGEGLLECYLEEWPPIEANIGKARIDLEKAKNHLQEAANELGMKAGVALDAHLLLGKLYYACGQYKDSIENYNLAELHTLTEKVLPLRNLRILAESFAIKGLCLEHEGPAGSRFKQAEKDAEKLKCFDVASDLCLLYVQDVEKMSANQSSATGSHSPQPSVTSTLTQTASNTLQPGGSTWIIMEAALRRAPVLYLESGRISSAIERYRSSMRAVETNITQGLRLTLAMKLAELLLRGASSENDRNELVKEEQKNKMNSAVANGVAETPWKPKKYTTLNQFFPSNYQEESILLLLIAEAVAVHNAVLSQSPEFAEARAKAYGNATAVYDLLALATVRWGQTALLDESFERAMKFSFEEPHVWKQHALCLISMGKYDHALAALEEVSRLMPTAVAPCLLAAKLCYEQQDKALSGMEWSEKALKRDQETPQNLRGRCLIYVGIGYQLQAKLAQLKQEKSNFNVLALEYFQKAISEDSNDHLAEYYFGLQLALMDRVVEAITHVRTSLSLRYDGSSATLQLLALLLSASRQHGEALRLVQAALDEYPDCLNLMHVRAHLELHELGGEVALVTAKNMLKLWKNQYGNQVINDLPECDRRSDTRSVFQLYTSEMSDKDSTSLQAHSVAASRVEQALSEVASSISSHNIRPPGSQLAWQLLQQVWLLLAEIYLAIEQIPDAEECVTKAAEITSLSHLIMYMRGLIHMKKCEWTEAKLCFQNAVAVNPHHIKSLQQLGLVYHYLGSQRVAETTLRDAAKIDPTSHQTWYILGKVLESLGEYESASNCMATALSVEITNPVLPFHSVPLCFE